jgi:hypothetical protein
VWSGERESVQRLMLENIVDIAGVKECSRSADRVFPLKN